MERSASSARWTDSEHTTSRVIYAQDSLAIGGAHTALTAALYARAGADGPTATLAVVMAWVPVASCNMRHTCELLERVFVAVRDKPAA